MISKEREPWTRILEVFTWLYCFMMLTLFLFYTEEGFFHITDAKYHCFIFLSLVFIAVSLSCLCIRFFYHQKACHFHHLIHSLSISDWCMLGLLASHTITLMISPYPSEAFSGTIGRHLGYSFTMIIVILYFLISRQLVHHKTLLHCFLIASTPVILLGIGNSLGWDPLHFFQHLSMEDQTRFLSTIGNVTFFAQLMCLCAPIAAMLLMNTNKQRLRYGYEAFLFIGFYALVIAHIDSAYLGLIAFLLFCFNQNVTNQKGLHDFLIVLTLFFAAAATGQMIHNITVFPSEGISQYLLSCTWVWIALALSLLGVFCSRLSNAHFPALPYSKIRKAVLISALLAILLVLFFMAYFTLYPPGQDSPLLSYLRFDDAWGSQRGLLWKQLTSLYVHKFTLPQKLFGQGLDCVRLILTQNLGNSYLPFDNAHNEYLQYLVTSGIIGLSLYLVLGASLFVRLSSRCDQPYTKAIAAAIITYGAQALTSLNQPIITPLLFLFFAIGESILRQPLIKSVDVND